MLELLPNYAIGIFSVLFVGIVVAAKAPAGVLMGLVLPARLLLILVPILLFLLQIGKLSAHRYFLDLAAWLHIFNNMAHGLGPLSTINDSFTPGYGHWFANHFTPFIYLFGWLFQVWDSPVMVFLVQTLLISSCAIPAYLIALRLLASNKAAVLLTAAFMLHPTISYILLSDFEMLRFVIPCLMWLLYFVVSERWELYWLGVIATILVREEVSLTVVCVGAYLLFFKPGARLRGAATMCLGAASFWLITNYIMPSFLEHGVYQHVVSQSFQALGGVGPLSIITTAIHDPMLIARIIFEPVKLANITMLLLPFLFLPLLSPTILMMCGANFAVGLLSGSITHSSYFLYYIAPSLPVLYLASVYSLKKLSRNGNFGVLSDLRLSGAVFAAAFTGSVIFGALPYSLQFLIKSYRLAPFRTLSFHYSTYVPAAGAETLAEALTYVPKSARVATEQHLLPHVFDRKYLSCFPQLTMADYVVFDKNWPLKTGVGSVPGSWDGFRQTPQVYYDLVEKDQENWEQLFAKDGFFVYRRRNIVAE